MSNARAYSIARRITRLFITGFPSSEIATQPARRKSPIPASSFPSAPFLIAPDGKKVLHPAPAPQPPAPRQLLPFRPFCNRADRKDVRQPSRPGAIEHQFRNRLVVIDGIRVGHTAN